MKSSTALVAALAALAALMLAAPASWARTDRIHVEVKGLANGKAKYKGEIEAESPSCEARRIVKVYAKDSRLVKTRTDSDGKFSEIGKQPRSGAKLTVKVPAKGECPKLIGTGRVG